MSRAFVKEDGPEPDENPPEKPVSPFPNYVTPGGAQPDPARPTPKDDIRFGARVALRRDDGTEKILHIVGEDEAEAGGDFVSWSGPFVQALFGLKMGEVLEWNGERWTVVSVGYPA